MGTTEVEARQADLSELARSFQRFRTFADETRRATKGKRFDIRNLLLWDALHAQHRMLVIDLADWVDHLRTSAFHTGWFRRHLQGEALGKLRTSKRLVRKLAGNRDRYVHTIIGDGRIGALKRLFGVSVARRGKATAEDVLRLEKRLDRWATNLRNWRNVHAHRLEAVDAKRLRLQDLAKRFEYCGRLMNNIRLLLDNSTYSMPSLKPCERDTNCRDLVDLLVVGDIQYAVREWSKEPGTWLWQKRDAHYARLHRQRRAQTKGSFNARSVKV
jgi:hypothetical protein